MSERRDAEKDRGLFLSARGYPDLQTMCGATEIGLHYLDRAVAAEAEVERLRNALLQAQWCTHEIYSSLSGTRWVTACPVCDRDKSSGGHEPDCVVGLALGEVPADGR